MSNKNFHYRYFIILTLFVFASVGFSQNRQAYLIINTKAAVIKCDSLFLNSLKDDIKAALIGKNIDLIDNDEVEKNYSNYLYLYVNISDSLYISGKMLSNNDNYVGTSRYDKKTWKYSDTTEIKNFFLDYIEKMFWSITVICFRNWNARDRNSKNFVNYSLKKDGVKPSKLSS